MNIQELYHIFQQHSIVTTDSRDCPQGSIFFALKGASFNGNEFASKALEQGCAYAVVDEKEYAQPNDNRFILVDDCLKTLQQLANYHRRQLGTRIIGITGTNGKTTTKELVSAVLGEKYNVLYTLGNFNNEIGVPKTLLRLTEQHEMAVVEMGASHPGDIQELVEIVEPDYAIITNVGKAHLQGFGSLEGVIKTKGELYDFMRTKKTGKVFIHAENEYLMNIAQGLDLIPYGTQKTSNLYVHGEVVSCAPFLCFKWTRDGQQVYEVQTKLIGTYNILNMLAATAIGCYFGIDAKQINHALTHYTPNNNRSQLDVTSHNKLIMDAYNANPTSMMAALQNFRDMEVSPKMAILGDMLELGEASKEEHQKIADFLTTLHLNEVWLVGEEFEKTTSDFRKFKNVEEVKKELETQRPQHYYILVKGSNGIRLSQLPTLL